MLKNVGDTNRLDLQSLPIGDSEYVMAYQTKQFEDYSKYAATMFDVEMVNKRHIEQFPKDCEAAFEMRKRLAAD